MRLALLVLVLLLATAVPASAHRLKLFATVEDGTIVGYAFFVGGGRPAGAALVIRDDAGAEVHRGATGGEGAFHWRPPAAATYRLSVDAGDGHNASATITADRLGGTASPSSPAISQPATSPAGCTDSDLAALVDAAVARQVAPLLLAHAEAEARLRFNDIVGGIGMILGLGGVWVLAAARRRGPAAGDRQ